MSKPMLLLVLLVSAGAAKAEAQMEYYGRLGAVGTGILLRDVIVEEITVRPSIAPMLALGASLPIGPRGYRVGLEGALASAKFHSSEDGTDTDLGTLRTGTLLLNLEGPLHRSFRWRVGLGGLKYWPSDKDGIFRQGAPVRLLAGAGLDYRRPVLSKWDLLTSLRYDFHRFTTEELKDRGFSQTQGVSRVSLSVGLSRSIR
ncbi:MAG TPA: hypothetical protein VMY76_15705 [Gemmatimonadales bacterium]|nr:hypothetical protein [Gemmatimonadales bacterium]